MDDGASLGLARRISAQTPSMASPGAVLTHRGARHIPFGFESLTSLISLGAVTEPNHYRYCDSCGFEGDKSLFIRKGTDGVAIRSSFKIAHPDQIRYGLKEARENGYYPYAEFCPSCGYNRDINDEATNAKCRERGRHIHIKRAKILSERIRARNMSFLKTLLITSAMAALIIWLAFRA